MCSNKVFFDFLIFGTFFCVVGISVYRSCASFLLNKLWKKWYIRRAVDASIVGFFALVYSAGAYESVSSGYIADVVGPRGYDLIATTREFWNLNYLLVLQWFVNNFGNYVIYPAFSLTAIGYVIERSRQQQVIPAVQEVTQK